MRLEQVNEGSLVRGLHTAEEDQLINSTPLGLWAQLLKFCACHSLLPLIQWAAAV